MGCQGRTGLAARVPYGAEGLEENGQPFLPALCSWEGLASQSKGAEWRANSVKLWNGVC